MMASPQENRARLEALRALVEERFPTRRTSTKRRRASSPHRTSTDSSELLHLDSPPETHSNEKDKGCCAIELIRQPP